MGPESDRILETRKKKRVWGDPRFLVGLLDDFAVYLNGENRRIPTFVSDPFVCLFV